VTEQPRRSWRSAFHWVRLVLAGGVVGAATGLLLSGLAAWRLPPPVTALDRLLLVAAGLGLGYWGGLLFAVALAVAASRRSPAPAFARLERALVVAGLVLAGAAVTLTLSGVPAGAAVVSGVAASALAARLALPPRAGGNP
jgi:hypothetical protein